MSNPYRFLEHSHSGFFHPHAVADKALRSSPQFNRSAPRI
nr:MAG TPA: hypothetical protein [Caudoviricetes sp.]